MTQIKSETTERLQARLLEIAHTADTHLSPAAREALEERRHLIVAELNDRGAGLPTTTTGDHR